MKPMKHKNEKMTIFKEGECLDLTSRIFCETKKRQIFLQEKSKD